MSRRDELKVLVVDDTKMSRRHAIQILNQINVKHVEEAEDGEQALAKLKEQKFDCLLLDWMMPKMTGIEVLRKIREDQSLKDLVVFMVTAEAAKEQILEAIKAGVSDYIVKPVNPVTLIEKINSRFK